MSGSAEEPSPGRRRAWGWVAHLRDGGTTPWASYAGGGPDGGRFLPGAQQLELLRRLNLRARPAPGLVERVLGASAPGRGSPDFELVGARPERRFGPRPVDPSDLPTAELVRVASGLVADDVVATAVAPPGVGRPRPWARPYRLVGDPWMADPVREELVRRGRSPGGRRPLVHVLGTDLATMLAHAWTARCFDEGGEPWDEWLRALRPHRRTPPRADLVAAARLWAGQLGADQVRIVLDPALLPRSLGVRRALPATPELSADGVELARRVSAALDLLVLPAARTGLMRHTLLPRLVAHPGPPLVLPDHHLDWAVDRARRVRDDLLADGYPVLGDLDRLVPTRSQTAGGAQPDGDGVLDLALRLLLEVRHDSAPSRPEEDR